MVGRIAGILPYYKLAGWGTQKVNESVFKKLIDG